MNTESLWKKFAESGSVADYLQYCAARGNMDYKNDNIRRNCS